ncbi:acetoacetate-CoA ligase [Aspergillus foveolatus]|uniref:acetoacetate-CoA ligase n=1 Tax=Aspergillus foveolatus TaxID=210207 RepID=UPI003CCDB28F
MGGFQARRLLVDWLLATFRGLKATVSGLPMVIRDIDLGGTDQSPSAGGFLWKHDSPQDTQIWEFLQRVNTKYGKSFQTYEELSRWSADNISDFWGEVWEYCGIRHSESYNRVVMDAERMWPRPSWFEGAKINLAENLLYPTRGVDEHSLAVIAVTETTREEVTWKELRERVRQCQAGMKAMNVQVGDRVAGFIANHTYSLVAMLATTSLGAIWTAVSPDTGVSAALDRLVQIEPVLLFADNGLMYNGKNFSALSKVREIIAALPSLTAAIILPTSPSEPTDLDHRCANTRVISYSDFILPSSNGGTLDFVQLPAESPVYILYSSGTTGIPKCIVHGAIGALIQHKREHVIQSDIRPGDRLCFITTCMWMMWHWLVSGLASGITVVLLNGSPFHYRSADGKSVRDNLAMPKLIDELGITQFGTSAKYLSILEQSEVLPRQCGLTLKTLKAVYSTGSPLAPSTFRYVYRAFGHVNLGSISGGTDIISDFGVPSMLNPVYAGEIQVTSLGMSVRAWDVDGNDVSATGNPGELVCVKPFPSQPVKFWGPDGERRYKSSYFDRFEGVWTHGDFIRFNPQTGGLVMLGRSDGILNPCGVRFGSAEIYNLLLAQFTHDIEDSLCVGRRREKDTDETVILFVKMRDGHEFTTQLVNGIKDAVRKNLSPRYVPSIVDACPEIPVTTNGKKVEVLIKQILSATNRKAEYSRSVSNGDCLDWYREWARKN